MIARKTWREIRVTVLMYAVILELLLVPLILLWPDFYPDLQRSSLFKNVGVDFMKRIFEGVTNQDEEIAYRNWIAVMAFFRSTNLIVLAAAVLLGTALFAREREAQTFELLISRPVSRGRILFAKSWPTALGVTLPIFAVSASAVFWSRCIGRDLPYWELFLASLHAAVFALCLLALTTLVSILCRVQAHVAAWVGGFTVLQLGIYMTPRLRPFSVFRLADFEWYGPVLAGNTPAWQMFDPVRSHGFTTWLLAATALFYGLAWRALRRAEP